jgi:twitching motility protein PilT
MDYAAELADLIETVSREGASDLHISEGRHLLKKPILSKADTMGLAKQLVPAQKIDHFFETKEIDFSYTYNEVRFRGNAYYQRGAVGMALRLIPRKIRTLEELNLPPILEQFTKKPQGFFLVVGPVGHGKSTTLASMIDLINTERAEHIMTIEDPIEYLYEQKRSIVDQREVGDDTNDFDTALKSIFREDIDVVLIGEMRSPDTISTAVTAAETGHLVFSTLHTNNAAQTVNRIIDSFPPTQQDQIRVALAGSLTGIFSQRLIPRISGGQLPAYELLINTSAVQNLIREKRIHEINTVIETGLEQGMIDMNRSLADLVRAGEITVENAFMHSLNSKVLERLI